MSRFLLISNGHGEDLSGVYIGNALKKLGHKVDALPLVGHGESYNKNGIRTLGKTHVFTTGGLGYTSWKGRLTELCQGQVFYLLRRVIYLLSISRSYDLLIVIGDIIPVIAAWLSGNFVVTYLVAYSSHYEGRLSLPWPCGQCLRSKSFLRIYSRDQLTADDLSIQLKKPVLFLGNPFFDQVLTQLTGLPKVKTRLGLLPGSRRPELDGNIILMLAVIEQLPEKMFIENQITIDMALVEGLDDCTLNDLVSCHGWKFEVNEANLLVSKLSNGPFIINVHRDSFVAVLHGSHVLMSMSGTAAEQAVGLEKPVLQLPGSGPQFTSSFAEAQRRLLGPTVFCADTKIQSNNLLKKTAQLCLELLNRSQKDSSLINECKRQAEIRIGPPGGAESIAKAIHQLSLANN